MSNEKLDINMLVHYTYKALNVIYCPAERQEKCKTRLPSGGENHVQKNKAKPHV
jgi:hypothetical protein